MSIKKSKFQNFSKLLWFFRRKKFEKSFIFRIKLNEFLHTISYFGAEAKGAKGLEIFVLVSEREQQPSNFGLRE